MVDNNSTTNYTKFVILGAARTGSNMLATLLNDSPEIVCFRELFNKPVEHIDFGVPGYDPRSETDRELRDNNFPTFLSERIFCEWPADIHAVGFKMPYEHFIWVLEMEGWIASHPDVHIVHLKRHNLLRSLASVRLAQKTGAWVDDQPHSLARALRPRNVGKAIRQPLRAITALWRLTKPRMNAAKEPASQPTREPVNLSVEESRFYFEWATSVAKHYDDLFSANPNHALYYEDMLNEQRITLDAVQAFLGSTPHRVIAGTRQQNPEPLSELIANYDELHEAFIGTEYEVFLD